MPSGATTDRPGYVLSTKEHGKELACTSADEISIGTHKHLSLHRMSGPFFGAEAISNDADDFFLFTVIAGFCVWPIVLVIMAIARVIG